MIGRVSFRTLFAEKTPLVTPSAHDALSAKLIELAGFRAVAIGGLPMLASQQAIPDIGLATLPDMVEGARTILRGTSLPCGIDADDGFGDVRSVVRTVRSFAALGFGCIILEDQLRLGKRPGDSEASALATIEDMQQKLRAACFARGGSDVMIQARTDSLATEGLDGVMRRAEAYLASGAESIFVSGVQNLSDLEWLGKALGGKTRLIAVVGEKNIRDWPPPEELGQMGYSQVAYPNSLIARAAQAMRDGLVDLRQLAEGSQQASDMPNFFESAQRIQTELGLDDWSDLLQRFPGSH